MTNVLIVADSATDASTTVRAVRRSIPNCTIVTATDTDHAIELMPDKRFDVVLLDLSMPRMDGIELLRRMRQSASTYVSVIAVSSSRSLSEQADASQLGITDFVHKAVSFDEFAARLGAAMSRKMEQKYG